jgi:hypothetical protein
MKSTKLLGFALSLASLMYLTACDDNNNNNNSDGNVAPAGFGARTMQVTVNDGNGTFSNTGNYTLVTDGAANATSGSYNITGDAGTIGDSSGTWTYNRTGTNTASLVLEDSTQGTTTDDMVFDTPKTGTITSSASGGTQNGTFSTN